MKRCPECLFIYPETDSRCDFDNTPLVAVDEAEIDAATKPRSRKFVFLILAVTVAFGFVVSLAYLSFARRTPQPGVTVVAAEPVTSPAPDQPSASPSPSPSPSASPTATPKNSPERIATAHTSTTVAPISTSGPGIGKRQGARPVIVLTTGARIEADEVWRTRDGVWYRRNGLVTLLKRGQVKTIANQ
jgi:hypothetical protein